MNWYEILAIVVAIITSIWTGWKLWKHVPREVGEALIEIANAVEDDRLTREEVRAISARYVRVINAVAKALKR